MSTETHEELTRRLEAARDGAIAAIPPESSGPGVLANAANAAADALSRAANAPRDLLMGAANAPLQAGEAIGDNIEEIVTTGIEETAATVRGTIDQISTAMTVGAVVISAGQALMLGLIAVGAYEVYSGGAVSKLAKSALKR